MNSTAQSGMSINSITQTVYPKKTTECKDKQDFDILNTNLKYSAEINKFCNLPEELLNPDFSAAEFMDKLANHVLSSPDCLHEGKQTIKILFVNSGNAKKVNDIITVFRNSAPQSVYHLIVQTKIDTDEVQDPNIGSIIIRKTQQSHDEIVSHFPSFLEKLIGYSDEWRKINYFNINVLVDDSAFAVGHEYKHGGTNIKYFIHSKFDSVTNSYRIRNSKEYVEGSKELEEYVANIEHLRTLAYSVNANSEFHGLGLTQTAIGLSDQIICINGDNKHPYNVTAKIATKKFRLLSTRFTLEMALELIKNLFDYDLITYIDITHLIRCMREINSKRILIHLLNDNRFYTTMSELDKFYEDHIKNDETMTPEEKKVYQSVNYKPRMYALQSIAEEFSKKGNVNELSKKAKLC